MMRQTRYLPIIPLAMVLTTSGFAPSAGRYPRAVRPAAGAQGVQARSNVPSNVVRGPAAPAASSEDPMPASLPGVWKVHLCIAGEQSWIRFEQVQSGEFHTLSYSR